MTSGWSSLRNPSLAKMFKYLHLIDNWGTGLERSIKMCNDLGIKVEVINDGIGIRVNIYRPSYKPTEEPTIKQIKSEDLTEQEQKIVDYIKQYGSIRRIVVEDILDIKTSRAAELLSKMVDKGIIKKTGNNKDVKYIL